MRLLLFLFAVVFTLVVAAQSFPVKKANNNYVVTNLKESERYKSNIKEVIRDKSGLCWFQNFTEISSFDGTNWKSYNFKDANGRTTPVRIGEIEVTDDSTIWLATAEGMYGFNRRSQEFVPIQQIFPAITGFPRITNCIYKGINTFLMISIIDEGFYALNWNKGELKYVRIDSNERIDVLTDRVNSYITTDNFGNYWGLTVQNKGVWYYNPSTGEIKRSWKGEVFPGASQRMQGRRIASITYSRKENVLLISYGIQGVLEKIYLSTGKSRFYTFTGNLAIRADTNTKERHSIQGVKIDPQGNEWLLVAGKYLVQLNPDITKCEYIEDDPELLPLGKVDQFLPETDMKANDNSRDDDLLWIIGNKGLSLLKKRNFHVKQIPFESRSVDDITPDDYVNRDLAKMDLPFKNIFFINGIAGDYLLLQQNEGRPKLLRFDNNLHLTNALFNDEWRKYPAYFNPEIKSGHLYVAMLRPSMEPLDFRNVVIKDFSVDLRTMKPEEIKLDFAQRIRRYGAVDAFNVSWLFSNGYLYSFDPRNDQLDSIFICAPRGKKSYTNRIKGYDFPTILHKKTGTFWISFVSDKELYKIDLKKRRIVKVIKSCLDKKDCLPTGVYQLYGFDSTRIYLKLLLSAALLNPANDSITFYSDLFKNKLPYADHIGSFVYKDWLCNATTSEINLQNFTTGRQKRLSFGKDFTGTLSELTYAPPVNARGDLILMSSTAREFIRINVDSISHPAPPGMVRFAFVKLNEKDLLLDSVLQRGSLKLNYNSYDRIQFKFSDYSLFDQDKIEYEYTLYNGGDTTWNKIEGDPELTFIKISPGNYKLLLRASNGFGDYSPQVTAFGLSIVPPFTQTAWFIALIVLVVAAILYGVYRYRLQQIKRLQLIRNNIASDLHDDIGSTLNSISIYSEVAKQQVGREIPALDLIGQNSRKIIESMSDIVWTINPENDSFEKIIIRMRSFAHQLLKAKKVEYTFEVDEKLSKVVLPMQVRKNLYLVFKESITNVIKYSGASRVAISLYEENKGIVFRIRDNGKGIPVNATTMGNGLLNMTRRASEIKAELNIISAEGGGTEVELTLVK